MKLKVLLLASLITAQSCNEKIDYEAQKKEILVLHDNQRKAHMEKNVSLLVGDSALDYLEINRGTIKKPSRAESMKRFQAYFNAVDFIKWDDATPPVFSFSDDGSMATTAVDKIVITKQKSDKKLDTAYYAWLAVYKKTNGKWQMHRMASTNK